MVDIRPFSALRYAQVTSDQMGEVTSPPYDVFNPELQRVFHDRHPHNIVRLIQGEILEGEQDDEGRIGRAAQYMRSWRAEGVLAPDSTPAIYPYRQNFDTPGGDRFERLSFFAAVRVEPFGEGRIFPHEQTFSKPKGYLFGLWGKSGAHLGPVFSFYDDPDRSAEAALEASMRGAPIADFEDDGVRHTLWRCDDPDAIAAVQKTLAAREGFIADGHHRYETSLNLRDDARAKGAPEGGEADYTLMCLANIADPGMVVLPTHRMLKKIDREVDAALSRIAKSYEIIEAPAPAKGEGITIARRLEEMRDENGGRSVFCLADGSGTVRYLLRKESAPAGEGGGAAREGAARAVAALDVSRLHREIIEDGFGASHDEAGIAFTPDPEAALGGPAAGTCRVSLMLNPTPIASVCEIAKSGGRMPHKSTYFFPKLRTGLVIHGFAPPALD